jgi:hypothetical protein
MKKVLFLLTTVIVTFSSCNKYEYGPGVSLRTKKGRISNTWEIDVVKKNGVPVASPNELELIIDKSGDITKTETVLSSTGTDSIVHQSGLWEFDGDAENVLVLFADRYGITESHIWRILKLTTDEFWYEEVDSLDLFEYRLREK